ncbi:hypothetical protein CCB81_09220 [Armatimonadetes bacterium Uphvl-Ar2]|nr:hypothetical protein CCB81_09220 [Armatimonadetes bacterium Uphvl-Ar2]
MEVDFSSEELYLDRPLTSALIQVRPACRDCLLRVFGPSYELVSTNPLAEHLNAMRLSQVTNEVAHELLAYGVEFGGVSTTSGGSNASELFTALPFMLMAMLTVDAFQPEYISFFSIVIADPDVLEDIASQIREFPPHQRELLATIIRLSFVNYVSYALGEGIKSYCPLLGAEQNMMQLIFLFQYCDSE